MAAAQSVFPRAEDFGVHDLIDPRETRPALCAWIDGDRDAAARAARARAARATARAPEPPAAPRSRRVQRPRYFGSRFSARAAFISA